MSQYLKPNRFAVRLNSVIGWLARRGISLAGAADLAVRGRKSGEWRRVPVNPMTFQGGRYLVSARGHSEWVRNMRAAGGGELRVGRRYPPLHRRRGPAGRDPGPAAGLSRALGLGGEVLLRRDHRRFHRRGTPRRGPPPPGLPDHRILSLTPLGRPCRRLCGRLKQAAEAEAEVTLARRQRRQGVRGTGPRPRPAVRNGRASTRRWRIALRSPTGRHPRRTVVPAGPVVPPGHSSP